MVQEGELAVDTITQVKPVYNSFAPVAFAQDVHAQGESVASDSLAQEAEPVYGLLLTAPEAPPQAPSRTGGGEGVSFILCGLFVIFLIIALRFRNNYKYVLAMLRGLVETKTRHNVFDDTVNESSMIVLLNILWCACTGIILFSIYYFFNPGSEVWEHRAVGMLGGMGLAAVYSLFMWCAYGSVGWIFSDGVHSRLWVKGFSSSQALMAPALFVTALVGLCRPSLAPEIGIVSAGVFILVKIIFIWKGYRIFFNQFSSWVLFLCYLCSLEIVPLILCYRIAGNIGDILR